MDTIMDAFVDQGLDYTDYGKSGDNNGDYG